MLEAEEIPGWGGSLKNPKIRKQGLHGGAQKMLVKHYFSQDLSQLHP
jgi:hypothetical protein